MNQIVNPPISYDAGTEFNYDVWTANSHLRLAQVPWDSGYKDVVKFASRAALNSYLSKTENTVTSTRLTYLKEGQPVRLEIPYAQARKYNYLMVTNPAQPIGGDAATTFYYFVKHARHVAPGTTELVLQLDIWQSFIYESRVVRGYLERGHFPVVLGQTDPSWLAEPEPFDLGADYTPRGTGMYEHKLFDTVDFVVSSTNSLKALPGMGTKPERESSQGSGVGGIPQAVESYVINYADLQRYFRAMSQFPWVTTGIFRVAAIPRLPASATRAVQRKAHAYDGVKFDNYPPGPTGSNNSYLREIVSNATSVDITEWKNIQKSLTDEFNQINGAYGWMKKFHTAPFSYLYLTDNVGRTLTLDPRFVGDTLKFEGKQSIVAGAEEIRVIIANYGGKRTVYAGDILMSINGFPTLPVVNDNATISLASQARGLSQSRDAAGWSQSRAMAGNQTSYDNANVGINAAANSSIINRNADRAQTDLTNQANQAALVPRQVGGVLSGVAGGGSAGGAPGAAIGAAGGAASALMGQWETNLQANAANAALSQRNATSMAQQANSTAAASGVRDNNRSLADWAARGDYSQAIAAIDAKVQDAQLIQPSMNGQVGGELGAWVMGVFNLNGFIKTIREEVVIRIGQYWSRYGYACNRFISVGSLTLMTRYTYWKLQDVSIVPAPGLGEDYLNALRGIFEKGVSIYEKPEYVNDTWKMSENKVK